MVALNQLNAMDPNAFGDLKRLAREGNSPDALRAAARQFEAIFLQMALKAMRDATPPNALFDSEQTRMFESLQDQQMAMNMAEGRGIGLADVIFRQLGGEAMGVKRTPPSGPDGNPVFDVASVPRRAAISAANRRAAEVPADSQTDVAADKGKARPAPVPIDAAASTPVSIPDRVRGFVDRVWSHAVDASRAMGVPPHFMIAQAALETGWGRAELRLSDGSPSHNIFNIKAGRNWKGPVVELPVTEYANGRMHTETARFRAYESYAEAFRDYVNLMRNSARYSAIPGQQDALGFAQGLQDAGYATDPRYAEKLASIIGGPTLRAALGN